MIISIFEFIQLLSLNPTLIDQESMEIVKKFAIYPMMYLNLSEDIIYTQMYLSYSLFVSTIFTIVLLKLKFPNIDIIFFIRLITCIGFGFLLYIPLISMLVDIFICTEEAKGMVFFDIDCNTECWDTTHMAYAVLSSFALVQIIPAGMYLRARYQELPLDLNILTNPTFILLKTTIIIFMIVVSKVLQRYETLAISCLAIGMLIIVGLHIIIQPFNYRRINLYISTICIIYVFTIVFVALPISKFYIMISLASLTIVLIMG